MGAPVGGREALGEEAVALACVRYGEAGASVETFLCYLDYLGGNYFCLDNAGVCSCASRTSNALSEKHWLAFLLATRPVTAVKNVCNVCDGG